MSTVTVYHNEKTDFRTFDAGTAELHAVISFDLDQVIGGAGDVERVLETVFDQLNVDSPDADWARKYRQERNRSLAVGDVVQIGESAWIVDRVGWSKISSADLADAIARGSDPRFTW